MKRKQDILSTLDVLGQFRLQANQQLFRRIFGDRMGYHLWDKFSRNYDVVDLYNSLDGKNSDLLAQYLSGRMP